MKGLVMLGKVCLIQVNIFSVHIFYSIFLRNALLLALKKRLYYFVGFFIPLWDKPSVTYPDSSMLI